MAREPQRQLQDYPLERTGPEVVVLNPPPGGAAALLDYWDLIAPWLRRIALCTVLTIGITFVIARFVLTHWYRAQAVLRPASQQPQSSIQLSNLLGNIVSGQSSGSLSNIFGSTATDVSEYLSILKAVEFNVELIKKHKLQPLLTRHKPLAVRVMELFKGGSRTGPFALYRLAQSRLDCEYDANTGNLTISFLDPDPKEAVRVLSIYIDSLQTLLREWSVRQSSTAIKALQDQMAKTSDSLLVAQLDQLLAQQLQALGTAELQADFAFIVVDPPVAPDAAYSPRVLLDCLAAAVLTPLAFCLWLIVRDRLAQVRANTARRKRQT